MFTWTRDGDAALATSSDGPPPPAGSGPTDAQWQKLGDLLVGFLHYLESNAVSHPAVCAAIPAMTSAVAAYRSRQSTDPYQPIQAVLSAIETARQQDPTIPQP